MESTERGNVYVVDLIQEYEVDVILLLYLAVMLKKKWRKHVKDLS